MRNLTREIWSSRTYATSERHFLESWVFYILENDLNKKA